MTRRGKDNDYTKSGQLRRRGQYRIQHVMMIIVIFARLCILLLIDSKCHKISNKLINFHKKPVHDFLKIHNFFAFLS